VGNLKRRAVEVLLKAGHRKTEVAQDDNTNGHFWSFCAREETITESRSVRGHGRRVVRSEVNIAIAS
jgi:hypothetical protein